MHFFVTVKIALLEPYFIHSHRSWAEGLQEHSQHEIKIFSLSGAHWKWRMHGSAITLVMEMLETGFRPDLVLAGDMTDLTVVRSALHLKGISAPCLVYFHENQLTYPWNPTDADLKLKRDRHYAYINYTSAWCADAVLWNSAYHHKVFLDELPKFLEAFPDHQNVETVEEIRNKSHVIYPGIDFSSLEKMKTDEKYDAPLVLWNHRWEYDKNPIDFFNALYKLSERGVHFKLAVAGQSFGEEPSVFAEARERLQRYIVHWGFAESFNEYARLLWLADVLPVTSHQEFYGYSVLEAVHCNTYPLLPHRLVYPEHFTDNDFFYHNRDELVSKLEMLLASIKKIRGFDGMKYTEHLAWPQLAVQYDTLFETFAAKS